MTPAPSRFERLEFKFLIDETRAHSIRERLDLYCERDRHCQAGSGYRVCSLYLDGPDLTFHRAKERGDANRLKLRLRRYVGASKSTLEIKRRNSDVISKSRIAVDHDDLRAVAHGDIDLLLCERERRDLLEFSTILMNVSAQPTLLVRYAREAYESTVDRYVRVTFDREIEFQPQTRWDLEGDPNWLSLSERWRATRGIDPVLLEIKCETHSIPLWLNELVIENQLVRQSFSKYSLGIALSQIDAGRQIGRSRSLNAMAAS